MPHQTIEKRSSSGSWPSPGVSSAEAVVAAQRASQSHMSHQIIDSSTVSASLTTTLPHRDIVAESYLPRQSIYQRTYSRRQTDYEPSQRRAVSSTSSTISSNHNIHRALTTSASIASFEMQTSFCSEQLSFASTKSSLVCVRDYPTEDTPLPGWQLHFVEDGADSFEPLREPDDYLYDRTLRRSDKGKTLSWKGIKKVRVPHFHVVFFMALIWYYRSRRE